MSYRTERSLTVSLGDLGEQEVIVSMIYTPGQLSPHPSETPDDPAEIQLIWIKTPLLSALGVHALLEKIERTPEYLQLLAAEPDRGI